MLTNYWKCNCVLNFKHNIMLATQTCLTYCLNILPTIIEIAMKLQFNTKVSTIIKYFDVESYSRGRRGVPAKDVGVEMRARVQIPHSPPNKT